MTNYEWLLKNNEELVKNAMIRYIGKEAETPKPCISIDCENCDFHASPNIVKNPSCCPQTTNIERYFAPKPVSTDNYQGCMRNVKEWLEEEHEPLYKKGDIVIDSNSQLTVVKEDYYDGDVDVIIVSHFVDNTTGIKMRITEIEKKVGHIEEGEVK